MATKRIVIPKIGVMGQSEAVQLQRVCIFEYSAYIWQNTGHHMSDNDTVPYTALGHLFPLHRVFIYRIRIAIRCNPVTLGCTVYHSSPPLRPAYLAFGNNSCKVTSL